MQFSRKLALGAFLLGSIASGFALDREAFTFTKYDLQARVEPEQQRLEVRGNITLRNDSASPQKDATLQISSSLNWRSIKANGKPVQFVSQPYTSDIDHTGALSEAIVSLPAAIPPRGTLELEIGYEGVLPLDATRLTRIGAPAEAAVHSDWDQIGKAFTAVRGIGYVAWYPVATEAASLSDSGSVPDAIARWKQRQAGSELLVNLCSVGSGPALPAPLMNDRKVVVGRGSGASDRFESCNEHEFPQLGDIVPTFVLAEYTVLSHGSMEIDYLQGHKSAAEDYALAADLASPFVTDWFGPPRQRPTLTELQDPEAAPFESGAVLFAPLSVAADARLAQMTAVHQLTHAAFHSSRPWIEEGLAAFAQAAYREQQSGRQAALEFMGLYRASLLDAEKNVSSDKNAATDESLINTGLPEFQRGKAMYVWWMLRDMIGDVALKKALAAYRTEQDKDPAYMQHLVEAASKRDLEWFFDDWVYRDRGLPDFKVDSAYVRPTVGGSSVVTVTIENLGTAGAEVPFTVHIANGDLTRRLLVPAKSKASMRVESASAPETVKVNDGTVLESDTTNNSYTIQESNH
jgi:hypothetical protein